MAHTASSATGELKRKMAVFGVCLLGSGVILHFALPWFDFVQLIGSVVGFAFDYPKAAAIPVAFLLLLFLMAIVDDRFQG